MGGCVHGSLPCITKQYKEFPVCSQKECCFQVCMSGFEIRDFGFICETEQIETLSAWQKEREHYKVWGIPSTCFMVVYN